MISSNASRKIPSSYFSVFKTRVELLPWKASVALLVIVLVGCQGQTFQYSRGWTNGKRGGGYPAGGSPSAAASQGASASAQQSPLFDMENGSGLVGVGVPLEDSPIQAPLSVGGALRMGLPSGTQGRLRSLDYAQFLNRKLASGSTGNSNYNHKQPMWIVGLDQENNNGDF